MYFVFPSSILGIRIRRICLYFFLYLNTELRQDRFKFSWIRMKPQKFSKKKIYINLFHIVILFFIFNILFLSIFKKSEFVTINYVKKEILSVMKCTSIITLFTIDSFPLNLLQYYIGKHLLPNIYKGLLLYIYSYIYIYKWYHCIGWWGARQLLGDGVGWGLVETVEIHLYRGATALEYHIWMFIFLFLKYLLI